MRSVAWPWMGGTLVGVSLLGGALLGEEGPPREAPPPREDLDAKDPAVRQAAEKAVGKVQAGRAQGGVPLDDPYLKKFVAASEYNSRHAEWNKQWYGLRHDTAAVEAIFKQRTAQILAPLVPRLRTFEGGEYARVRVVAIGEPLRNDPRFVGYHLDIYGTIRPRELPPGKGGMRPLVDTCYLAWVKWDTQKQAVARAAFNTGRVRALSEKPLNAALKIAGKFDEPDTTPPKFLRQVVPVDTEHPIVALCFLVSEQDGSARSLWGHIVGVDLQQERVLGISASRVNMDPVFGPARQDRRVGR